MLLALAAWLCAVAQATRTETWPDGSPRATYTLALDERGLEVEHGPYRAFFADGTLAAEGAFAHGRESGPWLRYHPNGARAAAGSYADGLQSGPWETFFADGSPESQGSYVRGVREGRWNFWRSDGSKDLRASGLYRLEVYRSKEGERHYRGYVVDNVREGRWTSYWPDKSVQLEGELVGGLREGPWLFRHPDGTPSALLASGVYAAGRWNGRLVLDEPPPFERARFPPIEPSPHGWPSERIELAAALRTSLAARKVDPGLRAALGTLGARALPVALELLGAQDPESAAGRAALGFLEHEVLRPLCAGHGLSPDPLSGPRDAPSARELVRAWLSLWAATRDDLAFWELEVPRPARAELGLRGRLADPPLLERDQRFAPAARAEPEAALAPVRSEYRLRFGKEKEAQQRLAAAGTREGIARALAWLAAHQAPDGRWSNAGFAEQCGPETREPCGGPGHAAHDVGASGLALLAFLGDGHTSSAGQHRALVTRGLAWLVAQQKAEGLLGERTAHDFIYDHAIATTALCEAVGLGADELRAPAERALAFLLLGRHPEAGWHYDVPATDQGDTSVTSWALGALFAAHSAGLPVDPEAWAGGLAWIERMSDPQSGRVGYTDRGELSARTSENQDFPPQLGEALTGAGLLARLRLGQKPKLTPILEQHARLIAATPPRIDRQWGGDQYYWYTGTCALYEFGAPYWEPWEDELRKVVILSQQKRGHAAGSWDPLGPWGTQMGRLTATALLALTLECVQRYPRVLDGR